MVKFKKGDKVSISDGQFFATGIIQSVKSKGKVPVVIKTKQGKVFGALIKDIRLRKKISKR